MRKARGNALGHEFVHHRLRFGGDKDVRHLQCTRNRSASARYSSTGCSAISMALSPWRMCIQIAFSGGSVLCFCECDFFHLTRYISRHGGLVCVVCLSSKAHERSRTSRLLFFFFPLVKSAHQTTAMKQTNHYVTQVKKP
jgi:hypothetical protein